MSPIEGIKYSPDTEFLSQEPVRNAVGPLLSEVQVIEVLDVSPDDLTEMRIKNQVLGVAIGNIDTTGTYYYPAWQFDLSQKTIINGVPTILELFKNVARITVAGWARLVNPELGDLSPADSLIKNQCIEPLLLSDAKHFSTVMENWDKRHKSSARS